MHEIVILERGNSFVTRSEWSALRSEAGFWELVDSGILTVAETGSTNVRIGASGFVGKVIFPCSVSIEIREKIPGSLRELILHATTVDFRIEHAPSSSSNLGPLVEGLCQDFLGLVSEYITRGRMFRYTRTARTGSLFGGRIRMSETVALRARGMKHMAAFEKDSVDFTVPRNLIVLAALREFEGINRLVGLQSETIARARALSMLFSDCRSRTVIERSRAFFSSLAASEAKKADAQARELLSLAAILLSHQSFEFERSSSSMIPRAWFLNLEYLFEKAIRRVLSAVLADRGSVSSGGHFSNSLFRENTVGFLARPDYVISLESGFRFIGDAKYKNQGRQLAQSDVYQLACHASAFGVRLAFLVYPGDQFSFFDLGDATTGARIVSVSVRLTCLEEDLRRALSVMMSLSIPADTLPPISADRTVVS